jgi:predicted RNA binding protein YcfA (HicA-like mRNA interferase family)
MPAVEKATGGAAADLSISVHGAQGPRITVAELQRALRSWVVIKREGGNHQILTHVDRGGRVTIPRHPSATLKPKTLLSILDQAGLSIEEFRNLL